MCCKNLNYSGWGGKEKLKKANPWNSGVKEQKGCSVTNVMKRTTKIKRTFWQGGFQKAVAYLIWKNEGWKCLCISKSGK